MRIYLASVTLDDVRWAFAAGLIDGIVATPAVIAAQLPSADPRELVQELSSVVPLPVIASVSAIDREALYKGARELARLAEQVVVAVPLVEDALPAIKRLSAEGVRVAATLVHNAAQAVLISLLKSRLRRFRLDCNPLLRRCRSARLTSPTQRYWRPPSTAHSTSIVTMVNHDSMARLFCVSAPMLLQ